MTYSGFTPGLNFGFNSGIVPITTLRYGSPIGDTSNIPSNKFDFSKLTPEAQNIFAMVQATKQDPLDLEKLTAFDKSRAYIARDIAKDKFKDEASFGMMMTGVNAAAKGLQTALAGGSPEMLAYNAQAPLREGQAYIRNSQNRQRQEIVQQPAPAYMYPRFFNVG